MQTTTGMMAAAQPSKYRRQADAGLSRMEIMEGAALCFEERGFAATSLDHVAARIRSTKGRIYHHYGSKAELFLDVFRAGMMMNFAAIEPILAADMPAIDRLKALVKAHVLSVIRTKPFQNVVWEGVDMLRQGAMRDREHDELTDLARLRDDYAVHFQEVLDRAREAGDIRYRTVKIALNTLFMCMNGPIIWFTPRDGQGEDEIEAIADECVLYAMRLLNYAGDLP
ncbi:TetR family transcriptional regulator [Hoeflea marina]|uniref:TetR family transcriptional regulator n=1 Tax=Hoeflea marina TaxID=274592 RepID=A0A317PT29_9HYPH|nr:TetR/AcrR family transcriptional regulator [Hoeflea marina]PWW03925.1 TetR family transcriptional regulator [Hoeflea marina]